MDEMSPAKPIALQNQGELCLHKMSVTSCGADWHENWFINHRLERR
jgi:hypothetical protein